MKLKRVPEEKPECFYGQGKTWIRLVMMAKETSGFLYIACRIRKRPKNPKIFDHNISPGLIMVKSAISDSDLMEEAMVLDHLHGCLYIRQMLGEELTRCEKDGKLVTNLLLEYCSGGNLRSLITQSSDRGLPEASVRQYTRHILLGLARIHEEGYVYGALKPENVLFAPVDDFNDDEPNECLKYIAKLGDLGLTRRVDERRKGKGDADIKYMAPETLFQDVEDYYSDIWALGCIVIEMVLGHSIWNEMEDSEIEEILIGVWEGRKEGDFTFENLSNEGKDFLERCLVRKEERSSARMLLNHPFVREIILKEEEKDVNSEKVLEVVKEVFVVEEAGEGIEEKQEMSRMIMSGDFIPLELEKEEEDEAAAVEDGMSEYFVPLELEKEEVEACSIIPYFQKK